MPRYKRLLAPGALVHIISRFVNREFRVRDSRERSEYLRRIGRALERSDMKLLGLTVMSSHVHQLAVLGQLPPARFIQPLHVGYAGWLNKRQGALGPVFAERYTMILCDPAKAARILAYLHNNPVRAGVVRQAADSSWSSHCAYVGESVAPPWLDVEAGLSLCGFDASTAGRAGFDAFVRGERLVTAAEMGEEGLTPLRAGVRRSLGAPVEITGADESDGARRVEVLALSGMPLRPRWPGPPEAVIAEVARRLGIDSAHMRSRDRRRRVVEARRLAVRVWSTFLGRPQVEMCAALGISQQTGSHLMGAYELLDVASKIADALR